MDTLFRRGPSHAVADRRKMGQSQRRVEEGGFEGGGVERLNQMSLIASPLTFPPVLTELYLV